MPKIHDYALDLNQENWQNVRTMNKISFALFGALLAAAAAPVLAELPDAATALAMIRERRAADDPQTATNGPSLQDLYGAYRALPLDAPPAREAESWLVLLDKLRETEDYNAFGQLYSGWRSGFLAPFFERLPAAEAWPAVREGLSTRAAASTNAAPLLDALQYVFDRLAHD